MPSHTVFGRQEENVPPLSSRRLTHYLPHALVATFLVAVVPLLAVSALERYGVLTSAFAATVLGVGLSVALARVGAWVWMRHNGSADLVFGDLMLWGWVRRARHEKRMADALNLLGLDDTGSAVGENDIPAARRADVLRELASSLEHGDPFTHGHTRRVTRYAEALAKTMRLPKDMQTKIRAAAAVHDVGKIDVPAEILNKPGRLTDEEFDIMKRHSARGAEMVERVGDPELTAMVRHHHERIDGRGYPDNLKGEDIPLGARVIAVADTFDAIISVRPYRAARAHREAIEILKRAAGSQLDEEAVHAFLAYYSGRKPLAWWLSVSTGLQRVLGGFGGWLQHARAAGAGVTHGATSLGATIALTAAMATVAPNLGVGQHSGPALLRDDRSVVVDSTPEESTAGASGDASEKAPEVLIADPSDAGSDQSAATPDEKGERRSEPDADEAVVLTSAEDPAPVEEVVVPPVVEDDLEDEADDATHPGKGKGLDRSECAEDDATVVAVSGDSDDVGGPKDKEDKDKSKGRGRCKDEDDRGRGKDKDDKGKDDKGKDDKGKDDKGKDDKGKDDDGKGPKGECPDEAGEVITTTSAGNGKGAAKGKCKDGEDDDDPDVDPEEPAEDPDDEDGNGNGNGNGHEDDTDVEPVDATESDQPEVSDEAVESVEAPEPAAEPEVAAEEQPDPVEATPPPVDAAPVVEESEED